MPLDRRAQGDILFDGHPRQQGRVLEDEPTAWVRAGDPMPVDVDVARHRSLETSYEPQQGRLARTRRPDQAHERPRPHRQTDVVDDRQWGAVIEEGMRHIEHVNRTGGGSIRLTGHRLI